MAITTGMLLGMIKAQDKRLKLVEDQISKFESKSSQT